MKTDKEILDWLDINYDKYLPLSPTDSCKEWSMWYDGVEFVESAKSLRELISLTIERLDIGWRNIDEK